MKIATDEVDAHGVGSDPDAMLALRARNDPEAFGLLYARYVHRVTSYFLLRTGNREDAEDLASQCFVRAFEALPRFRAGEGSVRSWLFAIAHNEVVSLYRRRHTTVGLEFAVNVVDGNVSPENQALAGATARELRNMLAQLSPDQQQVVTLRLAGLDGGEICTVLGKSRSWVDATQALAIRCLCDLWDSRLALQNE